MTAPTPDEGAALLQAMAEHGIRVSDRQFEKAVGALLAERDALRARVAELEQIEQRAKAVAARSESAPLWARTSGETNAGHYILTGESR